MRRRDFFRFAPAALLVPQAVRAQIPRPARLGILLVGNLGPFSREFRSGLEEYGYVEGRTVEIIFRSADGRLAALPELAAELVRLNADIIVASETPAVHAAKRATQTIPIVMAPSGDPVGTGLVQSLARPGGNIRRLSAGTAELAGKSLELIREILPKSQRIAALADPVNAFSKPFLEQIRLAANGLKIEVDEIMLRGADSYDAAFEGMAASRPDAVIVQPTLPRPAILALLAKHRLPSVSGNRAFADGGGLLSYAASLADRYRNAAGYIDKLLKGAKPSDLPVQQPTKFELVVN